MSGLCAIVFRADIGEDSDANVDLRAHSHALLRGVASRGPHASAEWFDRRIAIGHQLLKEVPEAEHESQPLHSQDGRYVIAFDGRIDNRDKIEADLPEALRPPRSAPDVAYALAAHLAWGDAAASRLLGDFAYLVWDRRERVLHAARDRLAGRPLYWVKTTRFLALCSSDDALLQLPGVSSAPNPMKLVDAIAQTNIEQHRASSWYRDVNVLAPGQQLRANAQLDVHCATYVSDESVEVAKFQTMDEVVEALALHLRIAVSSRLRCYGAPAMFLSGGIDSGSVIATAAELLAGALRPPIRTYSLLSDDFDQCVESRLIQSAIKTFSCTATTIRPTDFSESDWTHLSDFVWRDAHPVENSLLYQALLYRRAAAAGCTSMLNGVGGDVVTEVGAYPASLLMRTGQFVQAARLSRDLARNNTYLQNKSALEIWLRSARQAAPAPLKRFARATRNALRGNPKSASLVACSESLLAQAQARAMQDAADAVPSMRIWDASRSEFHSLEWVAHGQAGYDRVAARYGMVARDVWSDIRLIRCYLSIPWQLRVAEGLTKAPVRALIEQRAGREIARSIAKTHTGTGLLENFIARYGRLSASEALAPCLRLTVSPLAVKNLGAEEPRADLLFLGLWLERHDAACNRLDEPLAVEFAGTEHVNL